MKVLLTSHLFPNRVEPISGVFIKEQVDFLRRECEIKVVAPVPWFPPVGGFGRWSQFNEVPWRRELDGIEVFHPRYLIFPRMAVISIAWFTYLLALYKVGKRLDFDIIHVHTAYPEGVAAVVFARMTRRPVIVTIHGADINVFIKRRALRRMIVWALSRSDAVISISEELRRKIGPLGVPAERVTVIPNGVDFRLFRPIPRDVAETEKGLSKGKERVVYIGRFDPRKGLAVLIRAISILSSSRDNIELLLVGAKRGDEAEFAGMVERLGLTERVTFINEVPLTEVPLWLSASDLLVLPSFTEGLPLVLIEALACGKPVVSTRCGGPEEIVTDGTGLLVPPGDHQALAEAIAYVLDHPEEYNPVQIATYARNRFDLERISERIIDLYSSVIRN